MRKRHIVVGFSMIVIGSILFLTSVSLPHKPETIDGPDMAPIYKWLVGIPLVLVGIPFATAGFVKRIGKMTITIIVVLLISVWFLLVISKVRNSDC